MRPGAPLGGGVVSNAESARLLLQRRDAQSAQRIKRRAAPFSPVAFVSLSMKNWSGSPRPTFAGNIWKDTYAWENQAMVSFIMTQ
jgi:hypothetical protein